MGRGPAQLFKPVCAVAEPEAEYCAYFLLRLILHPLSGKVTGHLCERRRLREGGLSHSKQGERKNGSMYGRPAREFDSHRLLLRVRSNLGFAVNVPRFPGFSPRTLLLGWFRRRWHTWGV